ncbi:MAG: cytidine deaminase [Clostridia bacterium]|nr:cytidine deaminase [Clostridia bacterium]
MTEKELCAAAMAAMQKAYAPYSGCCVGAALLAESGQVYTGCNVENASYGATMCAERTALFGAVSQGERRFAMLAVAGGKDGRLAGEFPPCGLCRQALVEFCPPEMPILVVTGEGAYKQYTLGELLPMPFGPAHV